MNSGDAMLLLLVILGVGLWFATRNVDKLPQPLRRLLGWTPAPHIAPLPPVEKAVVAQDAPVAPPVPLAVSRPVESVTEAMTVAKLPVGDVIEQVEDDYGTTYTIKLPPGSTLEQAQSRREEFASAMEVVPRLVEITANRDDAGNIVRMWVGKLRPNTTKMVCVPDVTDWHDSFRIGEDQKGNPIFAATYRTNTLIGGVMRMGKTTLERHFAARAILDPKTIVILVDGKGSLRDWQDAEHCVNALIMGSDDDAVERLLQVFQWVLKESNRRNASFDRDHAGIVIVLDELQEMFLTATPAQQKQLVTQLGRVLRKGAAAGVHVVIGTQRPGGNEIPTTIRDVIEQKIGLKARDKKAMDLILGSGVTGDATLPSIAGEALYVYGDAPELIKIDYMDDAEWARACAMAPSRDKLDLSDTETPLEFFATVISIMEEAGKEVMSVEELAKAMKKSTVVLGRELSEAGYDTKRVAGKKSVRLAEIKAIENGEDG